jgi:hypothetical protein
MGVVTDTAYLDVMVFPWFVRKRQMQADTLRDSMDGFDIDEPLTSIAVLIAIYLLAPVLVVLLAWFLLPLEFILLVLIAVALVVARLVGLVPWHVAIENDLGRVLRRESTRSLIRAVRKVRETNGDRGVLVRLSWTR